MVENIQPVVNRKRKLGHLQTERKNRASRSCWLPHAARRVGARGLPAKRPACRPGALTGRFRSPTTSGCTGQRQWREQLIDKGKFLAVICACAGNICSAFAPDFAAN